jgi:hypothetical protein
MGIPSKINGDELQLKNLVQVGFWEKPTGFIVDEPLTFGNIEIHLAIKVERAILSIKPHPDLIDRGSGCAGLILNITRSTPAVTELPYRPVLVLPIT